MKKLCLLLIITMVGFSSLSKAEEGKCISGNCINGQGTYTYANGDKYVGQWKDGKMNGQGTYTGANGGKYVGQWKDDGPNGQGTATYADGGKYVGQWKDGKKDGQGTATYADGGKYVGQWKDGKRDGQGTYTFADGKVIASSQWKDDQPLLPDIEKIFFEGKEKITTEDILKILHDNPGLLQQK